MGKEGSSQNGSPHSMGLELRVLAWSLAAPSISQLVLRVWFIFRSEPRQSYMRSRASQTSCLFLATARQSYMHSPHQPAGGFDACPEPLSRALVCSLFCRALVCERTK